MISFQFIRRQQPAPWLAALWVLVYELARWRFFLPTDIIGTVIRFAVMTWIFNRLRHKTWRDWTPDSMLGLSGIFLVPLASLFIIDDGPLILARLSCIAGTCLWIFYVSRSGQAQVRRPMKHQLLYIGLLIVWSWWICGYIVGPISSSSGWLWRMTEPELLDLVKDDGAQYITLGQNLLSLFKTMYRLPGYPLLTRILFIFFGPNTHILIAFNILCLLVDLLVRIFKKFTQFPYKIFLFL